MLKKVLAIIIIGLVLSTSFATQEVMASWVGYSTEELIDKSEVILIGEIVEPVAEEKREFEGSPSFWVTHWKVKVHYYLKGSLEFEELTVTTPGAKGRSPMTSIDYRLDEWGDTVMLFLKNRNGLYEPGSPQGIVSLSAKEFSANEGEQINGQIILERYTFVNPQINDIHSLEDYIKNNDNIVMAKPGLIHSYTPYTNTTTIITASILILIVISGVLIFAKRVKKD